MFRRFLRQSTRFAALTRITPQTQQQNSYSNHRTLIALSALTVGSALLASSCNDENNVPQFLLSRMADCAPPPVDKHMAQHLERLEEGIN